MNFKVTYRTYQNFKSIECINFQFNFLSPFLSKTDNDDSKFKDRCRPISSRPAVNTNGGQPRVNGVMAVNGGTKRPGSNYIFKDEKISSYTDANGVCYYVSGKRVSVPFKELFLLFSEIFRSCLYGHQQTQPTVRNCMSTGFQTCKFEL